MKTPNIATLSFAVLLGLAAAHAFAADLPVPPKAAKRPYTVPSPHGGRTDEYHWLRDDTRKNPEMLAYLAAENAYREAVLAPTKPAQETLYTEMVARLKQDDASVPERKNGWWSTPASPRGRNIRSTPANAAPSRPRRKSRPGPTAPNT